MNNIVLMPGQFLSTLSLRRATYAVQIVCISGVISIHALLAESDYRMPKSICRSWRISIHALLAESDQAFTVLYIGFSISIHALLAESDDALVLTAAQCQLFLSTLSLRRATILHQH